MISLLLLLSLIAPIFAQNKLTNTPAFNTPIATTVEEAIKQQIIEGLCLPKTYSTSLFSREEPVLLHCESETAATKIVGRSLILQPHAEWSQADVEILVHEACLRVPYSGWREHAKEISEKTAIYWAEFAATDNLDWRRRVIATPFYKFVVSMHKGTRLIVYSITTGMDEMSAELQEELGLSYGVFKQPARPAAEIVKELPCEAWFRSRLELAKYHRSRIGHSDSRWPTAVHIRFVASSKKWSMIIGERSAAAPNGDELGDAVASALAQIVDVDQADAPREIFASHDGETQKSAVYKNLVVLWSRKTIEGMERIELQFRCRIAGEAN